MPMHLDRVRLLRAVIFGALLFCGILAASPVSAAVGKYTDIEGSDLYLKVDYRWAGTALGGYYPIRIEVENLGVDCLLTFRFAPFGSEQMPVVERRDLPVSSGDKAMITLSVPMVGRGSFGKLEIERDGEVLEGLTTPISLSYPDRHPNRSSALIISPVPLRMTEFQQGTAEGRGIESTNGISDFHVTEPLMLPSTWTDYTGLDFVIIGWKTLRELDAARRNAILQWAQTGGTLVVYELGKPARSRPELQNLLKLPADATWQSANLRFRPPPNEFAEFDDSILWPGDQDAFSHCDYMLGRVYGFPANPFPGTLYDWSWWISSMPGERTNWVARTGVLPRQSNENFFNFLIPGVTSVPIYAFLVLITLFTIIIGPLNYIFLRRRKKTYMLLLTIPAIAFFTSLTLFVYSTLAYGFSVTSRSRSLTVLDQRMKTAVSLSRISLFAGIAPSDGLTFSPDTAVYPMWAPTQLGRSVRGRGSQFESGRIVWGEQQEFKDGWLRSRTRTQFATVQHRTERGRLEIVSASASSLRISNGLEWEIKGILWVDENGEVYQGGALGAGNTGELTRVSRDNFAIGVQEFDKLLRENEELDFPSDIKSEPQPTTGILETRIEQFLRIKLSENKRRPTVFDYDLGEKAILPPRCYLAVLAERPGIELGVEDSDERAGYHLLLGYY